MESSEKKEESDDLRKVAFNDDNHFQENQEKNEDEKFEPRSKRKNTMETWANVCTLFTELQGKMDERKSADQLIARNRNLEEEVMELKNLVNKLEEENKFAAETRERNEILEKECAECRKKYEEIRLGETELQGCVDRLTSLLDTQSRLSEADMARKKLEQQVEDLTMRLDNQTTSMARKQIEIQTLRTENKELQESTNEIREVLEQKKGLVEKYQDIHGVWEMKEMKKLNTQLTDENASLRLIIEELEGKIDDLQGVVESLEGRFQEAKTENVKLQDSFHALKDERVDYQDELDCFQDGLKALQKEMAKLIQENDAKDECIEELMLLTPCILTFNDSPAKVNGSYQLKTELLSGRPQYKKHHEDTTLYWENEEKTWVVKNVHRVLAKLPVDVLHPLQAPSDANWLVFSKGDYLPDPRVRLVNAGEIMRIPEEIQEEQMTFTQRLLGTGSRQKTRSSKKKRKEKSIHLVGSTDFWKRSKMGDELDNSI